MSDIRIYRLELSLPRDGINEIIVRIIDEDLERADKEAINAILRRVYDYIEEHLERVEWWT